MRSARAGFGVVVLTAIMAGACASTAPAPGGMSDAEIVAALVTANQGEVDTSQPAVSTAASAAVREFAQRMVTEHTAARQRVEGLGITPVQNDYTRRLQQGAQQTRQNLATYSGAALDRTYMDTQIALHEFTLRLLDFLEPQARNGQLRTMIREMRTPVSNHLQQARQIRSGL